jgi:hypothetical protein
MTCSRPSSGTTMIPLYPARARMVRAGVGGLVRISSV